MRSHLDLLPINNMTSIIAKRERAMLAEVVSVLQELTSRPFCLSPHPTPTYCPSYHALGLLTSKQSTLQFQ